jgi:cytochrome c biogenesis protein CcmG/thiol:disulfide interchange protein DsbE
MKISIAKIIIFSFVTFLISIFWMGLKINQNYDTKSLVGSKISEFHITQINNDDQYISEEDLKKNKYTLINFFASWCAPCRSEHKYLLSLSKQNKEIKLIGINFKDKKINANNFLKDLGNPYNFVGEDTDGKISISFGIYGIPESILINNELTVIKKIIGPIDQVQFDDVLKIIQ